MSEEFLGGAGPAEAAPENPETIIGAEAPPARSLNLPADENDAPGWDRLYKELGRPDTPEGYGLAEYLEGQELDPQFTGAMGAAMHGAGLSTGQAQKIAAAYQQEWQSAVEAAERQYEREKEDVMKSFDPGRIEAARRAFRLSGVSVELAEGIERSIGPRAAVELFAKLGEALGEDRPARGAEGRGGPASPEAVRQRIDQLMADPDFCRRYQRGEAGALSEIENLSRRAVIG